MPHEKQCGATGGAAGVLHRFLGCWLVSGAGKNRNTRILGEMGIGVGKAAEDEGRAARGFNALGVNAIGAKTCGSSRFVSLRRHYDSRPRRIRAASAIFESPAAALSPFAGPPFGFPSAPGSAGIASPSPGARNRLDSTPCCLL